MRLALSNIAWSRQDDEAVAGLMQRAGVGGLEIAPTAVWPDPLAVPAADAAAFRDRWRSRGIEVVAFQALLFGHPELVIFGDEQAREATLAHLTGMMDLAARLGARPLVFGSPKNRQVGPLPAPRARDIAVRFFRDAGRRAADRGVQLCLEPNPPAYGCDFIHTVAEGVSLVREVDHPGFGLHVDAGAITMNGEAPAEAIAAAAPVMGHFHASEPNLAPLGTGGTDHAALARALRAVGYSGWVSVEMRPPADGGGVERAVGVLTGMYGSSTT